MFFLNYLFFQREDDAAFEETATPFNIHQIEFHVTSRPLEKDPSLFIEDVSETPDQSSSLDGIIKNLLSSFSGGFDNENTEDFISETLDSSTETILDIPDKNGHTFIKVIQDSTGQTIEFLHDSQTEITPATKKIPNAVTNILNSTNTSTFINKEPEHSDEYYVNTYIIIALVLVIILYMSACGIWWFRKNRLRAEKRNAYPVLSVANGEYMDPSIYKNSEKCKNIA